jgi:hypothetical protein
MLDAEQYAKAGIEYTWRASVPIVMQTMLILVVVALLGPLARVRRQAGTARSRRFRGPHVLALLTSAQLLVFLLLEVSERLHQREPFIDGLFASSFGFELLFAVGSAFVLAVLGSFAIRVVRSLRRQATTPTAPEDDGWIPQIIPPPHAVIVVGDVRAPPPLLLG